MREQREDCTLTASHSEAHTLRVVRGGSLLTAAGRPDLLNLILLRGSICQRFLRRGAGLHFDRSHAVPVGCAEPMNVNQRPIDRRDMFDDGLHQLLQCWSVVGGSSTELGVSQFNRISNVVGFLLGADHQPAPTRVAFGLRGKKRDGQLPLAGAAERIGFGVIGHQHF